MRLFDGTDIIQSIIYVGDKLRIMATNSLNYLKSTSTMQINHYVVNRTYSKNKHKQTKTDLEAPGDYPASPSPRDTSHPALHSVSHYVLYVTSSSWILGTF